MINIKGFVHLILMLLVTLVIIMGIGFFSYKNGQIQILPKNISDKLEIEKKEKVTNTKWKKCVNYDLNIEFDCPDNWSKPDILSTETADNSYTYLYKASYADSLEFVLKFYYGKEGKHTSPAENFDNYIKDLKSLGYELSDATLSGYSSVSYPNFEGGKVISLAYPKYNPNNIYILDIEFKPYFANSNPETTEQIASSITFLNLLDTNEWIDYINSNLGIEFKYRPDLLIKYNSSSNSIFIFNGSLSPNLVGYENLFHTYITEVNLNGLDPKEYALENLCGEESNDTFLSSLHQSCQTGIINTYKSYSNNAVDGWEFYYNPYENTVYVVIFPNEDKSKYFILTSSTETGGSGPTELGLETIDQILSTFQFIK